MKNHTEDDLTLLGSVFSGLSVYFNYTGTSQCLDILTSSAPTLGEQGWNYQVKLSKGNTRKPNFIENSIYDLELYRNGDANVFEWN